MAQAEKVRGRTASTDHRTSWSWKRIFGRDEKSPKQATPPALESPRPGIARRISRKVVPGLPRPGTFKRQQSELRDRLEPTKPNQDERRTVSVDRRRLAPGRDSSIRAPSARLSAPELLGPIQSVGEESRYDERSIRTCEDDMQSYLGASRDASDYDVESLSIDGLQELIQEELENRWILNLSMHFRDKSKREKFFVTFAETPSHWRRVTISLDYRDAPPGSLEEELQCTKFQRDKSAKIFESIRESLADIQFYDTVTNLKLQTEDERLHVHVVEDLGEVISFPSVGTIKHLDCPKVREDDLVFESHLSGFVYKVRLGGQVYIKKEIPGPDTVDEFLYEIEALHRLSGSTSVIQFGGVVLDNRCEVIKGLLISFAEKGALIDIIFDGQGKLPWKRRERWAQQIIRGLSEIHEAGFVQGDFTLSNIVIDAEDNAKIIDINRRGCPVGWEPPEVAVLIESNQRIAMYIGAKSDLYQLGMVLYALAAQHDEPETQRPFDVGSLPMDVPQYYLEICNKCLSQSPRHRPQAITLLDTFPKSDTAQQSFDYQSTSVDKVTDSGASSKIPKPAHQSSGGGQDRGSSDDASSANIISPDCVKPERGRSPPVHTIQARAHGFSKPKFRERSAYAVSTGYDSLSEIEAESIVPMSKETNKSSYELGKELQTQETKPLEKLRDMGIEKGKPNTEYSNALVGIGGAISAHCDVPPAYTDDDLTTDIHA